MEIYYAFVAFHISYLSARSGVQHTYKGSNVGAFVLWNLEDNVTHSLKFFEKIGRNQIDVAPKPMKDSK